MAGYMIEMFTVSLMLTILIEGVVAFLMNVRTLRCLVLVVLVNLLTNPAAVLLAWLWRTYAVRIFGDFGNDRLIYGFVLGVIELCVIVVEALIYRRRMEDLKHPWLLSLFANGCSFLIGNL